MVRQLEWVNGSFSTRETSCARHHLPLLTEKWVSSFGMKMGQAKGADPRENLKQ